MKITSPLAASIALLLASVSARAQSGTSYNWLGADEGNWNVSGNWNQKSGFPNASGEPQLASRGWEPLAILVVNFTVAVRV